MFAKIIGEGKCDYISWNKPKKEDQEEVKK